MGKTNANDAANEDLLIELGCEELPPKSLPGLAAALFEALSTRLSDAGLDFDAAASRMYYTPRRLAVVMRSVAYRQPDRVLDRKGPALAAAFDADGRPTKAALGFARSVGKPVDALERFGNDQGEWLFSRVEQPGAALRDLLFPMLEKSLAALPVTRPMRWASHDFSFVRPVHWLVAMHGSDVIDGELFGHEAGNTTLGHRIHSSGPVTIESAEQYESVLESAHVVADAGRRRQLIEQQVTDLAAAAGHVALLDDSLLDEVSNLVEWPVALACEFDPGFLDVPAEALIASMQDHQKFFPVTTADGSLTATFVAVANLESRDVNAVRKGFERVIRPRLADARFFWDEDRRSDEEAWSKQLGQLLFQKKLGSVGDKSKRIATVSKKIAEDCDIDPVAAERASRLCKCDLVSQMVNEFPE
ncbi:MAG: glycine--tRNA ligase subunit beta, partial [Lysobacterales bacterium]